MKSLGVAGYLYLAPQSAKHAVTASSEPPGNSMASKKRDTPAQKKHATSTHITHSAEQSINPALLKWPK